MEGFHSMALLAFGGAKLAECSWRWCTSLQQH
jgi:hypothetical protein